MRNQVDTLIAKLARQRTRRLNPPLGMVGGSKPFRPYIRQKQRTSSPNQWYDRSCKQRPPLSKRDLVGDPTGWYSRPVSRAEIVGTIR